MELATTRVHLPRSIPYQSQATSLPIASVSATSRKRCRTGSASPQVTTRWLGPGQRAGAGPPAYSRTNAASAQWHAVECSPPPRACDDQRLKFENTGESGAERAGPSTLDAADLPPAPVLFRVAVIPRQHLDRLDQGKVRRKATKGDKQAHPSFSSQLGVTDSEHRHQKLRIRSGPQIPLEPCQLCRVRRCGRRLHLE